MASVLSPNTLPNDIAPANSLRDPGVTYNLSFSVNDEDEVAPLPTRGRTYTLSITVDPKDATSFDEKVPPLPTTIEGSGHTDNLKQLGLGLEAKDEDVQALVRGMAALLANAASKEGAIKTMQSRPLTTLSTSSSRPTLVENDSSSVSSEYVEIIHRPAPAITSPRERTEFLVNLPPPSVTPGTAPGTPLDGNFAQLQPLLPQVEYSPSPLSAIRAEGPVTRDLITPVRPLATYDPSRRQPTQNSDSSQSSSIDLTDAPAIATVAVETPVSSTVDEKSVESSRRWWHVSPGSKKAAIDKPIVATVAADNSTIILPSPPTDFEKTLYAQTRRVPLYVFGTLSFLSVSVGMWFFAISSTMFYWFGVFVGLIQIYLIISYMVGYCGKDFDVEAHKKLVAEHSYCSDKLPLVDIYLPCCHEPLEVLENTYKYVSQLQYPNFKVYVLDDGGLDTVKALAESFGFNYITRVPLAVASRSKGPHHAAKASFVRSIDLLATANGTRDNKPHLKKAGNLRYAFARTQGDFFAIFDADFCPRTDFLDEMLPYMNAHPDIAIVQSPQFFRPIKEQTWTEQGASATQELFYRIVQVNRDRWGASICVGSNALYRRAALADVGGTAEIGHSEDVHTGFYALTRGWKLKYIPLALACGVSPDTPRAFFSQQMRWCAGSTTLLTNPDFWKSDLTVIQKICYMSGMMYYTAAAFMAFLASLPGLMMLWANPGMVMWFNFAYAFPSLIYSIFVFRLWSRQRYNFNVNFVFTIQQYAYLMAIKDRVFGTTASWVPSGDNKAHVKNKKKRGGNNKYRNMRILCAVWMGGSAVALTVGVTLRIIEGYAWYNFLPLILLDAFNLFITHKFIFYTK